MVRVLLCALSHISIVIGEDEKYYEIVPSDGLPTVLRRKLSFPFKDISCEQQNLSL